MTDCVHDAAVAASVNVPVRNKKRSQQRHHALESFENLPDYLRDNEFIHGSYRKEQSMRSSFLTLFKLHNETGNVWSHLIGRSQDLELTGPSPCQPNPECHMKSRNLAP